MFKLLAASTLVSSALAHGVISYIDVNGQGFTGPQPDQSANSPIWTAGIDPVTDVYSGDMFCGPDSSTNNQMASIGAGSEMTIYWEETQGGNWPHNTGPIITYLAACNGDCANVDASSAKWFKIDQQAFSNGQWVQTSLMNGAGYQVTIPSDLAAGNYLMRTEIIALHNSYPEFYPRCVSWTVTGGGSNTYSSDATGSFPGSYSTSDAGLSLSGSGIYNVQSTSDYSFPGPALITVGQGGSSGSAQQSSSAPQPASSSSAAAQPTANVNAQYSTQEDNSDSGSDDMNSSSNSSTQPTPTAQAAAAQETSSSASPAPSSSSAAEPASTSSCSSTQTASEDECETRWTQCNKNYVPGQEYTCQQEFSSCRGQSIQRRLASNARMMRKRVKRGHYRHAQH